MKDRNGGMDGIVQRFNTRARTEAESGLLNTMTDEKARAAETLRKTMAMLGKDENSQEGFDFHCFFSLILAINHFVHRHIAADFVFICVTANAPICHHIRRTEASPAFQAIQQ